MQEINIDMDKVRKIERETAQLLAELALRAAPYPCCRMPHVCSETGCCMRDPVCFN
jgi:hypothetical protein